MTPSLREASLRQPDALDSQRVRAIYRVAALPFRLLIALYQRLISPLLPRACRYYPSCSAYAADSLRIHGLFRGGLLAVRRLLRCHPWAPGGIDPVPRE